MKFFLMFYLGFSISFTRAGDVLSGNRFIDCDSKSKHVDLDCSVDPMPDKEEFEAEVFRYKDSKSSHGKAQFAIGRT